MRVENSDRPVAPTASAAHQFLIGQDTEGHWLAVETHGLGGGIFITRDAAWHYALHETGRRPGAIILSPQPIALS